MRMKTQQRRRKKNTRMEKRDAKWKKKINMEAKKRDAKEMRE